MPGSATWALATTTIPETFKPGDYALEARIDPDDRISETDESNNTTASSFALLIGEAPGLGDKPTSASATLARTPAAFGLNLPRGPVLFTLPLDPSIGRPFTARDLALAAGVDWVASTAESSQGISGFRVFFVGAGTGNFELEGGNAYLLERRGRGILQPVIGKPWPAARDVRRLSRGLHLLGYPGAVVSNETASALLARTDANFVARLEYTTGRFRMFIPNLAPDFDLETGRGYLVSIPAAVGVVLPACRDLAVAR